MRMIGCGVITSAFVALVNEISEIPPHMIGFMNWICDMDEVESERDLANGEAKV